MKASIYVDGFNLYYGAVKGTSYKWLDIAKMCQWMLPNDTIHQIKYFTALVKSRPSDPSQRHRQEIYHRALRTIPNLEIYLGHFLTHEVRMPLAPPDTGIVKVLKTEEKGSDVNLALHMLSDGYKNVYDVAIVITNDSDLLLPVQFVKRELGKKVGLLNPQKHTSRVLQKHADFVKKIRPGVLAKSQFPDELTDAIGTFHKPKRW